jgi:hypothetical protein
MEVPHIWHTRMDEMECWHLAMNKERAVQAHLFHHRLAYGQVECADEGPISAKTARWKICFAPSCVLHGIGEE